MTTSSPSPSPWARTHTVAPSRVCGTEYWPDSNITIGVLPGTTRVVPNATVCGCVGTGCSRVRSSANISTGGRFVVR